jgi:SHS2 domain-containing protein
VRPKFYRLVEHTADLGMEISGEDLPRLYANAALALFDVMIPEPCGAQTSSHRLHIDGSDTADLMVNWLREVLYIWTDQRQVVKNVAVEALTPHHLDAVVTTLYSSAEHQCVSCEIKAVTYHRIAVEPADSGWRARVVFDI